MLNDELQQIQKDTFHRIVLGLIAVGIVAAVAAVIFGGFNSPWLVRAIGLILAAVVAYGVSIFRRLEVASYVLVFQLVSLSLAAFLQPDFLNSFIPYLFIPIVIITGTLLKPRVSLVVAGGLVIVALLVNSLLVQVSMLELGRMIFPLGLTLLTALLTAINTRNLMLYDDRLLVNRTLLKSRALELMQTINRLDTLELQSRQLEKQVQEAHAATGHLQTSLNQRLDVLMTLVQGAVDDLGSTITEMETIVEQLADAPALNGQRHLVDDAWHKLYRLRSFVVNLDELAQLEQNSFELNISEIDLNRLLREVAGATQGLVRGKELEIRVHPAEGLPLVPGDPDRLRQVLLHLVNNAIKFTDSGLVELRTEQDDRQVVVMVIDTGLGMTSQEASRAFDLFGRGSNPAAQSRQGSGLGLAICRQLIELHGGRIWVTSEPGNGSIFYFSLPLQPVLPPMYATSQTKTTLRFGAAGNAGPKSNPPAPAAVAAKTVRPHTQSSVSSLARKLPPPSNFDELMTIANADDGATLLLRRNTTTHHQRNIQPIHRYQPMYIRRFGVILLGLLTIVLLVVAFLAAANYAAVLPDAAPPALTRAETTAALPESNLASGDAATAKTLTAAVASPTAAVSPSPPPTLAAAASDAPTAPIMVATEEALTSTPAPQLTQPPATATTVPPTPTPTASPPGLAAVVLPTSTPAPVAAQPAAVIEIAPTPPAPAIFTVGPGGINRTSAADGAQSTLPLAVEPGSRVSLSPGGQMVYSGPQSGGRDVFVAGADGLPTNLTNTPTDDIQPAWSPDGQRVAFSSGRTGSFKIFTMAADGSGPAQLTGGRGFDEWPAWSPDGQQLAFVSDRDGNAEIYVVNANGGNLRRLTENPAEDWPVSWSPGGNWLVFGSNRDGNWNLYLLPAAGGAPVQLTNHPADERDPVWLPGGDIAFAHNGPGNWDIFTLTLPTNQIGPVEPAAWEQITNTPQDERFPALVN